LGLYLFIAIGKGIFLPMKIKKSQLINLVNEAVQSIRGERKDMALTGQGKDTSFYIDYNYDKDVWCVFGNVTGKCYEEGDDSESLTRKALQMNRTSGNGDGSGKIADEGAAMVGEDGRLMEALFENHVGFQKLVTQLKGKGNSETSAKKIAYSIGAKKYGKKAMAKAASTHKPLKEAYRESTPDELELKKKLMLSQRLIMKHSGAIEDAWEKQGMTFEQARKNYRSLMDFLESLGQRMTLGMDDFNSTAVRAKKAMAKNPLIKPWVPVELGGEFTGEVGL
jgi:hypothetical protein